MDTGALEAGTRPAHGDVRAAARRIAHWVQRTPVLRSGSLDRIAGATLYFKCENLQRVGAFKFRGASNAVLLLDDARAARGVVTRSSGNHGAALALAAKLRGIPCHVVVPRGAPAVKLAAIRDFGASITSCEPNMAARNAACAELQARTGAELVHPFDDGRVIAGQGTATLELIEQAGELDAIVAPVGGGGLLSGTALAAHGIDERIAVIGAEPEAARDAHDSLASGVRITDRVPDTICDGLRGHLGVLGFDILRAHCAGIGLASEQRIAAAMRLVYERLKLVIEPSAAVALAVVLADPERFSGRRVGIVLSGGNVDLDALPWQGAAR
ncbi:MAG TPA: pyridoxal-phosphate dependent enzyme [Xanthomonadales bacterium]|nr:pyridoxal-phosphate dependent enzyme [Xanthomonadales bacterium]